MALWEFPEADAARETVAARGHVNGRGPQAERSGRDERSEVSERRHPPETVVEAAGHRVMWTKTVGNSDKSGW